MSTVDQPRQTCSPATAGPGHLVRYAVAPVLACVAAAAATRWMLGPAAAIAVTLLVASFLLLGAINLLQSWSARRGALE